ncbi:tetratricopeptide repeat-containing diguanylate cyclase [Piscinibacter sp.]|uniref:tetratricopeptide repeat-containing diguanylate cyclase n=1 Tax=Piscinibacter sp. TaxID=1903157 RepID=UPI002C980DAE|nr:diguanylate cyclase [Albitalea sp.]HUG21616.1 diguanylate cyclase [Albitalea sp.]
MSRPPLRTPTSAALRLARKAWRLQYRDSHQSIALAEQALTRAQAGADSNAEGWARLVRAFHRMRYATPAAAIEELHAAQRCFDDTADRAGAILAGAGISRCRWREGRYRESLALILPLRDDGLRVLKQEERGMLLNGIAGCYSSLGQSEQAFAYMYQALRESSPARGHGFDVVLYCNLAHELYQLGDYHEALRYLQEGIERCTRLDNPRLLSVLLVNRIVCLTDLDRPQEAMPDVRRVLDIPADAAGRGAKGAAFETLAIAALRAGELALGEQLIERAVQSLGDTTVPDETVELAVAQAESLRIRGATGDAAARLEQALPLPAEGLSLRVRCLFLQVLADVRERQGDPALALASLRDWQRRHVERTQLASRARYQAAALQTELLRLQQELDEIDARQRATERAKLELEAINQQLSQKVSEVQSLQDALKQQAVRDFLTGLFNRRHLNDVLPSMMALAARDRQPLAVAIIDLDHFKRVNDEHGHTVGDLLLAGFGALLAKHLRKSDVACRYGGEEFCLLMPRTDATAARRKVSALLKLWRHSVFATDDGPLSGCTFSAGIADTNTMRESAQALLKCADERLLDAKRLGRSRVLVSDGAVTSPL